MSLRSTHSAYGLIFLFGLVVGSGLETSSFRRTAHADALDPSKANDLYNELEATPSVLTNSSRQLAKIISVTSPSVVHIQSRRQSQRRGRVEETGSGLVIQGGQKRGDFIVTNRHVVADAALNEISIHLHDGRVLRPEMLWEDQATDVAVLKVSAPNLRPARWGDSSQVEIGHMVLAMGSPFGLSQSVTFGIISAIGRRSLQLGSGPGVLNQDFLQTDAAINPGNSGGPLIDMTGRVIGINTAIASNSGGNEGIGFSIPSNLVKQVVEQLLEHGRVQRAYLGVILDRDFETDEALRLKLDRVNGARVVDIVPNTPAARASVRIDDVILTFDGTRVQDQDHLINLVSLTPIGRTARLEIWRDGQPLTIQVQLGDREMLDERSEAPTPPETRIQIEPMSSHL